MGEVAAAIVLLIGAGLLMKTVFRLQNVDPGFQMQNVITMKMALPQETYKPDAAARFYDELRHRVAQLPGVQSIGLINLLPMQEGDITAKSTWRGCKSLSTIPRGRLKYDL